MNDMVEVQYRYFRTPDGGAREEVWCQGKLIAEHPLHDWWLPGRRSLIDYNWLSFATLHRQIFTGDAPGATHSWIDGSCICTAIQKQGPCALTIYRGEVA